MSKWGYPNKKKHGLVRKIDPNISMLSGVLFFTPIIYQWVRNHGNGMIIGEIIPGANFRPMKTGSSAGMGKPLDVHPIELNIPCNL